MKPIRTSSSKILIIYLISILCTSISGFSQEKVAPSSPPVVHSEIGDVSDGVPGHLRMVNVGKRQQFSGAEKATFDTDIFSPKSVSFSRDGKRFYVNSLEGCKTVIYDTRTLEKLRVVEYKFESGKGPLWAFPSGYYKFRHYPDGEDRGFRGKPVESAWSHNGRYLWVPFYRRTFDINAQDPSAIAVIDANDNQIIRMMETGPLPKMVAASNDGKLMAVTHWGDNTVGLIDISSSNPSEWHHLSPIAIGRQVVPDYPLDKPVNRDANSGYLLRGTLFTPDNRYLLVSGMAGPLGVIDVKNHRYAGSVQSLYGIRHLAVNNGFIYGSKNYAGAVIKVPLDSLVSKIDKAVAEGSKSIGNPKGIEECKVGGGARTLEVSPDGKYIFVACNSGNALYAVDAATMKVADHIRVDSYPVGLAISKDGRRAIVTSQGRKGFGGNAVNIFDIERPDLPEPEAEPAPETDTSSENDTILFESNGNDTGIDNSLGESSNSIIEDLFDEPIILIIALLIVIAFISATITFIKRPK